MSAEGSGETRLSDQIDAGALELADAIVNQMRFGSGPYELSNTEVERMASALLLAAQSLKEAMTALERVLSWWPEGSERNPRWREKYGDAFEMEIQYARGIFSRWEAP